MTTAQERAAAARKAAEEAARVAAEAAAAAEAAEKEAAAAAAKESAERTRRLRVPRSRSPPVTRGRARPSKLGTVVVDGQVDPTAQVRIPLATVNRHGLVAGATGTGKTKTLQGMAEQLSAAGVPVVMADVKGDLSGCRRRGSPDKIAARAARPARGLGTDRIPERVRLARNRRDRGARPGDHHLVRADPAQQGAGAQRDAGVHPRADLPLGRHPGPGRCWTSRICVR